MRLDELRVILCVGCGRADVPLKRLPAAMSPNLRACDPCLARYGGASLAREADETLAGATPARARLGPGPGRCLHCGEPTVTDALGNLLAWCSACEGERRALMGG
jgi:hypothetical protein